MRLIVALLSGFLISQIANLFTTVYLHRTLSHRAVTMKPFAAWCFRIILWLTTGLKPRVWAAVHRKHHAHTDTAEDPHSPAVLGWKHVQLHNVGLYRSCAADPDTVAKYARDLPGDRWDRALFDRAWLGLALGITLLCVTLGPLYGAIASVAHTVIYLQLSSSENAIGHHFGKRPYENSATNQQWLAWLTAGEGLHNNHHAAPTSATMKLHKGEIDPGWWCIALLRTVRLASVRLDKTAFAAKGGQLRQPQPQPVG